MTDFDIRTPIYDFTRQYCESGTARFHMPGHKGRGPLGFEEYDITEVNGADALYEADGIIEDSELIATKLFDTGRTFYSTEGSSQCIKSMVNIAIRQANADINRPYILAARNVHKAFIYALALNDCDVKWLYQDEGSESICSCIITRKQVADALDNAEKLPVAVYLTSPDYLGNIQDIKGIAEVCHERGVLLLVDNAHGAYLAFMEESMHPIKLGADICCDSAHKTLPVLTGGAYLHISRILFERLNAEQVKQSMCLFGSTSPSYLTLISLDRCNEYIGLTIKSDLKKTVAMVSQLKEVLVQNGYVLSGDDPLKITIGIGISLADYLRSNGVECEFSDQDFTVLMFTPYNTEDEFEKLKKILLEYSLANSDAFKKEKLLIKSAVTAVSVREAVFSREEKIPVKLADGRICGNIVAMCPPAVPIVVPGEKITSNSIKLLEYYGYEFINVIIQSV